MRPAMWRPEDFVRSVFLLFATLIGLGLAFGPAPVAAQIVTVTNIEIRMVKTSKKPPLRITADTRNPNDFAVRDVEVDCTIKDKAGNDLATYTSIIYGTFQPNQRTTTRNLNIGAWPEQGYAALCVSKRGQRVTPAAAAPSPSAPPATGSPATAPTAPTAPAPAPAATK
jgi:hypothetical protein